MINKPRPGNWSPTDKTNTSLSFEYQTSLSTRHTDQIMKHTEADSWQHWSRHHTTRLLNPYLLSTGIVRKGLHPCIMARVLLPEFCVWEYWSPSPQLMSGVMTDLRTLTRGCRGWSCSAEDAQRLREAGAHPRCRDHSSQFTGLTTQHYRNVFMQHFTF